MPLRAKIAPSAMAQHQRSYTTPSESEIFKEQPGDEPDDVLVSSQYGVRSLELNRPTKLNSLNGSMIRKIAPRLREWQKSELAGVIVMKGVGRAFCAGGDVATLAQWNQQGEEGQQRSKDYFALEYKLDHLIASYRKPYVAFLDGITMGGGVGLSVHAPFRIATENTVFAMPETTIGFFPDVGASFFLPKMDGNMGAYLALTSEQLKGVDAFYHGIATHYIHSTSLPDLEARLGELIFKDYSSINERYQIVNATIEEFVTGLPEVRPAISGAKRQAIDRIFNPHSPIASILGALEDLQQDPDASLADWATATLATLRKRSPTSVLVTLRLLRDGASWSIDKAFRREHTIASHFMSHPDFVEGVTEQLLTKPPQRKQPHPAWDPPSLDQVPTTDVDAFFAGRDTLLLPDADHPRGSYTAYPHAWIGLPTERQIVQQVQHGKLDARKIMADFVRQHDGKLGVREKVAEVLERRADVADDGTISGLK